MERQLSRDKLEALLEIQMKIDELEFEDILPFLVSKMIAVLKVERCSIFQVFPDAEMALLLAGEPKGEHGIGDKFSFSELEQVKDAVEKKEVVLISDVWNDKRTQNTRELFYFKNVKSVLLVPIIVRDEVVALLVVDDSHQKRGFSEDEIYFSRLLANQVGRLLERDMAHKEIQEKATLALMGEIASEALHLLRNPIMVIGGFANRLEKKTKSFNLAVCGACHDYSREIKEGIDKMEKLVNDLIKFSGPKRTKQEIVNINDVLCRVSQNCDYPKEKVQLKWKLDPDLPGIIGDPADLEELISSIFKNALEAIREEGEIRIKSKREDGWVRASISNNGGCIRADVVREMFNPFFTTKPEGTGLGLSVANSIVKAYNGEIKVGTSKELGVTTFAIRLPIQP